MRELVLAQYIKCLAIAGGRTISAISVAKSQFGENSPVARLLEKSYLTVGDLGADPDYRSAGRAFIELVRSRSLLGKIQALSGFRKVPANTKLMVQNEAPVAYWTAEGQPVPITHTGFDQVQLAPMKIMALIAMTQELLQGQGADFESAIGRDLVKPVATLEGMSFIDPANAGIPGESPASITHGVAALTGSSDPKADMKLLIDNFSGDLETAVLVCTPTDGLALYNAGYLAAGARGGEVGGLPLATSSSVPVDSSGSLVALIDPAQIMLLDDGVNLAMSEQATVQTGEDTNGDPEFISFWQQNLAGILATRRLNWKAVRPGAVSYLTGCAW